MPKRHEWQGAELQGKWLTEGYGLRLTFHWPERMEWTRCGGMRAGAEVEMTAWQAGRRSALQYLTLHWMPGLLVVTVSASAAWTWKAKGILDLVWSRWYVLAGPEDGKLAGCEELAQRCKLDLVSSAQEPPGLLSCQAE